MKKMQDTASPGHFVCRRMLILKTFLVILLWSTCLVSGYRGHAQERAMVTVNMTDVTLNEVITELKKQTKYDFFYNSELVKSKGRVSVRARNLDLREVLEQVLTPVGLEISRQGIFCPPIVSSQAQKADFTDLDIREMKVIPLNSKKAKLLSVHPADSYTLETGEDGNMTLKINDENNFWKQTKYLVVMIE